MALPQRIAALPSFMPKELKDAAPGHRFQLYLEHWQGQNGNAYEPYKKARPQGKDERNHFDRECVAVLKDVCAMPPSSLGLLKGLRARQKESISQYGLAGYSLSTTSTAPFATGLGNEHPIENGFAFLSPYGLPYLAGSSVKGILRRAMQELSDDAEDGFTDEAIDALFGPEKIEKPEDARRGALHFWDVFPAPAGDKLAVEIMTPHHGGYYQNNETPHDSGSPNPVSFLAVPAKSQFDFHVVCQPGRLPVELQETWRSLLDRAFQHAFEWVGFGAKTSVGYGAMALPKARPGSASGSTAKAGVIPSETQTWPMAKLTLTAGTGEIHAEFEAKKTAGLKGTQADALKAALGDERAAKLKKNKELKGVAIEVEQQGNSFTLKGLASS